MPGPDRWVGLDLGHIFLVPFPSVFLNYSGILLRDSEDDKTHSWQIGVTVYRIVVMLFVAAACQGVFMSKAADTGIVVENLSVFVTMSARLTRWTT